MFKKIIYATLLIIIIFILLILGINFWPTGNRDSSERFENIIVFGDSLSDSSPMGYSEKPAGNNYWTHAQGVKSPSGAPITSEISKQDVNRYTWFNYLIKNYEFHNNNQKLAIKRELGKVDPYVENVSYAVASAETGDNYIDDKASAPWPVMPESKCEKSLGDYGSYSCVPGVRKQVRMYLDDVNDQPNENTLFVLWAGGNDFYQNIVKISGSSKEALSHPISNIVIAVQLLLEKGVPAKNIYVFNLPNFSMVPAITTLVRNGVSGSFKQWAALTTISMVSKSYNTWLKSELVLATYGKFSPSNVLLIDDLFLKIYNNKDDFHQKLNITHNVAETCTDGEDLPLCKGFLFYNDMHPVTEIHAYLSQVFMAKLGGKVK